VSDERTLVVLYAGAPIAAAGLSLAAALAAPSRPPLANTEIPVMERGTGSDIAPSTDFNPLPFIAEDEPTGGGG
jgi:hypothetical protein